MKRYAAYTALLSLAPLFVAACGDSAPPPKTPTQKPVATNTPRPQPPPQQLGMSDVPSSGTPDNGHGLSGAAAGPYALGLQAFAAGDLQTARAQFTAATQADPRSHQSFYSLGVVQERLRDPGAGASYRQAFTIVPDYEPAIVAYAMLMAKKGQLSDAERLLNDKHVAMPKSAAVTAALAEVKSLQRDTASAQRLAQEALKDNPDYRPAMVVIARDHYRNRRLDLALYALKAILDGFGGENPPRDKNNADAMLLRGIIEREEGDRQGAMEDFKNAVVHRPDLVEARVAYATYLLEAGGAAEAQPVLEGALRFDPDNLPAHLALGDCYRLLGKYPEAKKEFDWVLAHDSSLPQVHYDLGLLYLFAPSVPGMTAKQQVQEATKELKRYQEVRKKSDTDDSDELLNRAKLKEGDIDAQAKANAPPPPAPAPSATPAPSGSAAAGPPKK